jgi:hypothetical protein
MLSFRRDVTVREVRITITIVPSQRFIHVGRSGNSGRAHIRIWRTRASRCLEDIMDPQAKYDT